MRDQVGKLQRDGAGGLEPYQPGGWADLGGQIADVGGFVAAVPDAKALQFGESQRLVGAVDIVGQQNFVAWVEQGQVHAGDGRQSAGKQQAVPAAFQGAEPLFQQVTGGRAAGAVGIAFAIQCVAVARSRNIGQENGRSLVHGGLRCGKALWRLVVVMNQAGGAMRFHDTVWMGGCRGMAVRAGGRNMLTYWLLACRVSSCCTDMPSYISNGWWIQGLVGRCSTE